MRTGRRRAGRERVPVAKAHRFLFVRHGTASFAAAVAIYVGVVLGLGDRLAISNNYFVILPVLVAALAGGTSAGLIAGLLALPANLLLFAILGHPEYSPASKPIAEASGIIVGFSFGYLADYFRELEGEIGRRIETEESLRRTLAEKELLLKELNHRVKNNLNLIKSLVKLQRNRSSDPAFAAAADALVSRILAISLVHDQLYRSDSPFIRPQVYLNSIAANVSQALAAERSAVSVSVDVGDELLDADVALPLGLVVNEALTNALKHAAMEGQDCAVVLSLTIEDGRFRLRVRDNGPGPFPGAGEGLGMKIIRAFAAQLGGEATLTSIPGPDGKSLGALFELAWPH